MKLSKRHAGLVLIALGLLTFAVSYAAGWTNANAALFLGLGLVVAGTVLHVAIQKRDSNY